MIWKDCYYTEDQIIVHWEISSVDVVELLIIVKGSRKDYGFCLPYFYCIKELHSIPSQVVQVIYVLPLLQARIQNRCECWFESIQTSFYPTIWAFYWVSFSIQFVNSLKSLQPAWRASAFSEQILFWRISPF